MQWGTPFFNNTLNNIVNIAETHKEHKYNCVLAEMGSCLDTNGIVPWVAGPCFSFQH